MKTKEKKFGKVEYDKDGSVVFGNVEWTWQSLKQVCHADFVFDNKPRGSICHRYSLPKEILNEWIENENWEKDKKSHWRRPYSYRIDSVVNELITNSSRLLEIQNEVNDVKFDEESKLSRVSIKIEVNEGSSIKVYKTIILEKYAVLVEGIKEHYNGETFTISDDTKEIRYKATVTPGEILIKFLKEGGKII